MGGILELKPRRNGLLLGQQSENEYVVALDEGKVYVMDPVAVYVWSMCTGERTVREIIEETSKAANIPYEDLEQPIVNLLNRLEELNLIELGAEGREEV